MISAIPAYHSPPYGGGAGGEAFFPQSHITPLPAGEGAGERLSGGRAFEFFFHYEYIRFQNPAIHQKGVGPTLFPNIRPTHSRQPPHVVGEPLQTPAHSPTRPRLSEDRQVALPTRGKTHNRTSGRTVAALGGGCVKSQQNGLKAPKAHSPRQRLGCTD